MREPSNVYMCKVNSAAMDRVKKNVGRERGRKGGREGGKEGGREGGREGDSCKLTYLQY